MWSDLGPNCVQRLSADTGRESVNCSVSYFSPFYSWWYNVDRKEADKQLLLPGNNTGTFLVREAGGNIT